MNVSQHGTTDRMRHTSEWIAARACASPGAWSPFRWGRRLCSHGISWQTRLLSWTAAAASSGTRGGGGFICLGPLRRTRWNGCDANLHSDYVPNTFFLYNNTTTTRTTFNIQAGSFCLSPQLPSLVPIHLHPKPCKHLPLFQQGTCNLFSSTFLFLSLDYQNPPILPIYSSYSPSHPPPPTPHSLPRSSRGLPIANTQAQTYVRTPPRRRSRPSHRSPHHQQQRRGHVSQPGGDVPPCISAGRAARVSLYEPHRCDASAAEVDRRALPHESGR